MRGRFPRQQETSVPPEGVAQLCHATSRHSLPSARWLRQRHAVPRLDTVPFDWRVLLFTIVVLIVSGMGMGILPAVRLSDTDVKTVLNEHGRSSTSSADTSRMMSSMIVAEMALAIALVAGAGWLIQSFARLRGTDPGFATGGRLVIDVRPTRAFSSPLEVRVWSDAMQNRVRAAAGRAIVGTAATFPLQTDRDGTTDIELATEARGRIG
jgi:putative ABC transport system permease protein